MAQLSQQSLIDAAKAPVIAYGNKDWAAVKAAIAPSFVYDEVASHRKVQGVEQVTALWQGWATALPDSKATFHNAVVSGETVLLEVTWNGTHTGPLQTPTGSLAATGKRIELRAVSMNVENRRILDMPRSLACLLLPCAVAAPAERSPASPKTRPSKE